MSNASNTMTDKLARETVLDESNKLASFADGLRCAEDVAKSRRVNTAAAFIGGALGVAATALSPRATPLTVGISAGVAVAGTAGVYANHPLHEHVATTALDAAAIGITKTATAAIVGALSNFMFGKSVEEVSEEAGEEEVITETND